MYAIANMKKAVDDHTGIITHFDHRECQESLTLLEDSPVPPINISAGSFIMPTFCDLHIHAPQFLYQGNGLDLPLMEWLEEYAFKAEERLDADRALATRVYTRLATRLIENGTGTVLLFGTIKEETNLILAEVMQAAGIRAFVGKLSMDLSSRPTYVESSSESALSSADSFVERCRQMVSNLPPTRRLVEPVLTPRFVPTCSDELLEGLGKLSAAKSLRIQSHMAEAHDQVAWVRRERGSEDIEVFERYRLLTPRTIQAHCTFLTSSHLSRVESHGTAIAHCPLSNAYFSAEPFHLREALQQGVKVGLGTDVAGGYSLNIMNAMRHAVAVSRMREGSRNTVQSSDQSSQHNATISMASLAINWKEALYLATQGGIQALGLPLGTGMFTVGLPFDAQQSTPESYF